MVHRESTEKLSRPQLTADRVRERIRALRVERGLTQKALGTLMDGMTPQAVSQYEHGKHMTLETLDRFLRAFRLTLEEFLKIPQDATAIIATDPNPGRTLASVRDHLREAIDLVDKLAGTNRVQTDRP